MQAPSKADPALERFALEQFTQVFVTRNPRSQLGMVFSCAMIVAAWQSRSAAMWPLIWFAGVLVVLVWRYQYTARLLQGVLATVAFTRIKWLIAFNGALLAVPLLDFAAFGEFQRMAVSIVLLASATAAVTTTSGYRLVFLWFAVPILLPLSVVWLGHSSGSPESVIAAFGVSSAVLLFLLYLTMIASEGHRQFLQAAALQLRALTLNLDLHRALQGAKDANQAKTRFLAAASHDLRQPIHSMTALIAALSLRPLDGRTNEIAQMLTGVTRMLSAQLDSLLDISKLDAGVVKPNVETLPIGQIVRAQSEALGTQAHLAKINLTVNCGSPLYAATDMALFSRIVANLADNALKFTLAGGTVELSARSEAGWAIVQVRDTGCGIAKEELSRVFEEFYQVANPHRDRSKGLGLGLSIVSRLCELLEVNLSIDSALGTGTTVTLRLPMVNAPATAQETVTARSVPLNKNVLVIDDELLVRQSMELFLEEAGCSVFTAEDGQSASAIAQTRQVDLVLCDLRLRHGESGIAVLQNLERIQPGLRAALITGDTAPDRIREAQAAGFRLLHKPLSNGELMDLLAARTEVSPATRVVDAPHAHRVAL